MLFIVLSFIVFSSEVLDSGIKRCFARVLFQDAVCEESFSICLRCLHLYFFVTVFEGFIPTIILVSGFFTFICINYPLKVFRFDTGILRDSCAVPLLKTLSRLPQGKVFLRLISFLMSACNHFPFRAFVTMFVERQQKCC